MGSARDCCHVRDGRRCKYLAFGSIGQSVAVLPADATDFCHWLDGSWYRSMGAGHRTPPNRRRGGGCLTGLFGRRYRADRI